MKTSVQATSAVSRTNWNRWLLCLLVIMLPAWAPGLCIPATAQ